MKRNIDLTIDFDFRKRQVHSVNLSSECGNISLNRIIKQRNVVDIPYCISNDIEYHQRGGIIQGDKYRRDFIKTTSYNIYCERCGRQQKYPWEKFYGLCPQCDKILESNNTSQILWNRP